MNTFSLHVWREWREHRFALLTLALVLPFGTWLLGLPLSRATVNDPLFRSAASLGFAIVLLVAVGGELLGIERRGSGLRWLERLPSGLAVAFRAKLAFFLLTMTLIAAYGYGAGWLVGCLRPSHVVVQSQHDLAAFELLVIVLGLWTFAASAWALRGGLSLLAAALILGVNGYPVWRVIDAGYRPTLTEVCSLTALLVPGALLSGWLAFVHGARLGRGSLGTTLCGLAPVLPVLAIVATWSSVRLAERDVFDPLAKDFRIVGQMITEDGRTAFVIGQHWPDNWDAGRMPRGVLRVDLASGSFENLGRLVADNTGWHFSASEGDSLQRSVFLFAVEGKDQPLVFDAANGEARKWEPSKKKSFDGWFSQGLGFHICQGRGKPDIIRDPFRGRDYPAVSFGNYRYWSELLVRPGKWLCSPSQGTWSWLDPDTQERTAVDWPAHSRPLVLFPDGRILLATEHDLRLVNPEQGTSNTLDGHGFEPANVEPNWSGLWVPETSQEAVTDGTIILKTSENAWLILDDGATSVRRLEVPDDVRFLRRIGADAAIVWNDNWRNDYLARLDLVSGELTRLWPPVPTN